MQNFTLEYFYFTFVHVYFPVYSLVHQMASIYELFQPVYSINFLLLTIVSECHHAGRCLVCV